MSITRRNFFGALGTAAAGAAVGPAALAAASAATSEQTARAKVIDVHTHMYSHRWADTLRAAHDPNVKLQTRGTGDLMIYRWSGIGGLGPLMFDWDARIQAMDAAHVDIALISLSAPNVYWGTRAQSAQAARYINEDFLAAQRKHEGRIRWMASLPWDYAEDALTELKWAKEQGAIGVCTLTNILGKPLTEERYARIWREIEAMRLPVFVHPTLPFDDGMGLAGDTGLANAVGFTSETSLCFGRLIIEGFLDRYPRLELIACHGGGALPYLAARIDRCWDKIVRAQHIREEPSSYLRRLHFDSIVYDDPALTYLVERVGPDRVLYGSDYPFKIGDMPGILARVDRLTPAHRDAIRSGNALKLFDL